MPKDKGKGLDEAAFRAWLDSRRVQLSRDDEILKAVTDGARAAFASNDDGLLLSSFQIAKCLGMSDGHIRRDLRRMQEAGSIAARKIGSSMRYLPGIGR